MSYRASRLPADLAGCGWYDILPPPESYPVLADEIEADWVVIGAGYAGLSAAKRLTERCPGDRVVVLEAQRIGWGACGRNTGFMIDLPHDISSDSYAGGLDEDRKQIRMNRFAIDYAAALVAEYGLQDFHAAVGKYHGAADEGGMKHLDDFCRHLDALDEPWSLLDRAQMQEITGTDFYLRGIHAPGTCMIQPAGYIRGLAQGLRSKVEIYEHSAVTAIVPGDKHAVYTPSGSVRAPAIILANNGHAQSLGFHRRKLMHIFTFASMTRSLDANEQAAAGGLDEWGLIPSDPMGSTIRRYRDRIVVRNTFTWNPKIATSQRQVHRLGKRHDISFANRFPMLPDVTMEHRWGGALCLSMNSVPTFGEVGERIWSAVCQNGLGTVKGTYAGVAAVDLATGQRNQIVTDIASYPPPATLKPEPFMSLGTHSVLWWKHRRAGVEL